MQAQTLRSAGQKLVLPLAFTLLVTSPAFGQAEPSADRNASPQKHKRRGWGQDQEQTGKTLGEGYYGSIKVISQPKEKAPDGYYSMVPACKVQQGPSEKSPPEQSSNAPATEPQLPAPAAAVPPSLPLPTPSTTVVQTPRSIAFNTGITIIGTPTLATAKAAFDRHEYLIALKQFQKLHDAGMCTDEVHYYIARCYQQNAQIAAAIQNYQAVMNKSRNETLRKYAWFALAQLDKYSHHRTYQGQGNNFQLYGRPGPASGGGGGGGGG